jgi:tRNA-specific 2-thiouridylase
MSNKNRNRQPHALALYSGGLDSILAILLMLKQNIRITALAFRSDFDGNSIDHAESDKLLCAAAERFRFDLKPIFLGQEFCDMVKSPRYGYGKYMNPCIDCRILMLGKAKECMEAFAADFVVTGEVIGQRPKSQFKSTLALAARVSGLKDNLVRPLSAGLLPETIPERNGLLDRRLLESISGRSRRRQLELAAQFDLEEYSTPSGGCLLTNPQFSVRLKDHLKYDGNLDSDVANLLKLGRHFRLDEKTKLIVGRHEKDNNILNGLVRPGDLIMEVLHTGSPIAVFTGPENIGNITKAAAITARYSDLKGSAQVEVICLGRGDSRRIVVVPADPETTREYQIL